MGTVTFSAREVRDAVPMAEAIDAVRDGFVRFALGEFEMPIRTALRDGQFLVMSAHHRPTATAMIKTLSLNFDGTRDVAITGTVVWSDLARTDHVVADAAAVTALRTGAASGVATDLLAPPDASSLVVVGAGAQAADQVRAVRAVRPLTEVAIVSRNNDRAAAVASALSRELTGVLVRAGSVIEAELSRADVVCCATTATEPLFELDCLKPNVHVNAIGSFRPTMRELPDELLADAGTVYIDEEAAVLEEAGEVVHALADAVIVRSDLCEIGAALSAGVARSGRTVFKSVGIAVQDWAVARALAERSLS